MASNYEKAEAACNAAHAVERDTTIMKLSEMLKIYEKTQVEFADANLAEQTASKRVTDLLNELNNITKNIDKLTDELRKSAPHRTDWHSDAHRHTGGAGGSRTVIAEAIIR